MPKELFTVQENDIKPSEKFKRICLRYHPIGGFTEKAKLELYHFCHRYAWVEIAKAMDEIPKSTLNEMNIDLVKRGQPLEYYRERLEKLILQGINQKEVHQRKFSSSVKDIMKQALS